MAYHGRQQLHPYFAKSGPGRAVRNCAPGGVVGGRVGHAMGFKMVKRQHSTSFSSAPLRRVRRFVDLLQGAEDFPAAARITAGNNHVRECV